MKRSGASINRNRLRYDYIDWLFYLILSLHLFFFVFLLSYSARAWINPSGKPEIGNGNAIKSQTTEADLPDRISIPKISLEEKVLNPRTVENKTLEQDLQKGIIRYPISGSVKAGNILILGHSSHLPNIVNIAYKIFNDIDKLELGDQIIVWSQDNKPHVYLVKSVRKVNSTETSINFDSASPTITLSTCNTLGKKEERILVEAQKIT